MNGGDLEGKQISEGDLGISGSSTLAGRPAQGDITLFSDKIGRLKDQGKLDVFEGGLEGENELL